MYQEQYSAINGLLYDELKLYKFIIRNSPQKRGRIIETKVCYQPVDNYFVYAQLQVTSFGVLIQTCMDLQPPN